MVDDASARVRIQRRVLVVLVTTQIIGGLGVTIGVAVGTLLAAAMGGTSIAGLGQSSLVLGAAAIALPITRLIRTRGRRAGLAAAYLLGAVGAAVVVAAAWADWLALLFVGLFCFGGGSAANLQARYAATDLSDPTRRARHLSIVVWATAVGAISGPNLTRMAGDAAERLGVTIAAVGLYAAPFAMSAVAFTIAGVLVFVLLRPDPLLTAERLGVEHPPAPGEPPMADRGSPAVGLLAAAREVRADHVARLGLAATAMGHLVMTSVMVMTPLHVTDGRHAGVETLSVVGVIVSLHIAGMYLVAPVAGWVADRVGRRTTIIGGLGLLITGCAIAGTAGHDPGRLSLGLIVLGAGWSGTMIGGSTLLTESVGRHNRTAVQGLSDSVMGLAGMVGGALSGVIVAWSSYSVLTALAAVALVPLIALTVRPVEPEVEPAGSFNIGPLNAGGGGPSADPLAASPSLDQSAAARPG